MPLFDQLARLSDAATDRETHAVTLLELGRDEDRDRARQLLRLGLVETVCDTLRDQLACLLGSRDPEMAENADELKAAVDEALRDQPAAAYGVWVHYPWAKRLVHVLPESEYRELRCSRNRNKITAAEQERLARLRIGIVGLSVGQGTAITLTLEGIGSYFALADFDNLELSNLNRLRAGTHELGLNKAVLCARAMLEIDPFLALDVWTRGVEDANVDDFLRSGGRPLGLVFEECDDLQMKLVVRERARAARIPVLMETSDRGLMDIERFDLEPERPIFHGLTAGVDAASLKGLSTYDKAPVALKVLGRERISPRMAASMVDVDTTLKSWPQTASEMALGSGINGDVARRIALGEIETSGRFYVDLSELITAGREQALDTAPEPKLEIGPEETRVDLPPLTRTGRVDTAVIHTIVAHATTAFSGGNCQPWRFRFDGEALRCIHEVERSRSFLDWRNHGSLLAFGSVIENIALVCPALGLAARFDLFPDARDEAVICDVHLSAAQAPPEPDPLYRQIPHRCTNRQLGERVTLDQTLLQELADQAAVHGCRTQWLTDGEDLDRMTHILGRAELLRMTSKIMHGEMMRELRWTAKETEETRDGMNVASLELSAADLAGMRLISSWSVMRMVGIVGGGWGLQKPSRRALRAAAAVGLVTIAGVDRRAFFCGGRGVHRLWLAATAHGLAFQPMTPITFLFDRLLRGEGEGLSDNERAELAELRELYLELFDVPEGHAEPMLFRLARAAPPSARALRRRVDDILQVTI